MGGDDDPIATRTRSRKRLRHTQNDTVSTQSALETIVDKPSPPFLPEGLIVEILVRLPVRSLLQFKCVSKTWKTLISDPQFEKSHFLSSTPTLQLVSTIGLDNSKIISYPLKPLLEIPSIRVKPFISRSRFQTHILGSCNGLICLHNYTRSNFRLWNPSINFKSKTSPTFSNSNLKSNPKPSFMYRGFGYDQVNDRYKVLVVLQQQHRYNYREYVTLVYTFGENSWTTVQNFPLRIGLNDSRSWVGKFVSGTLNWIIDNNNRKYGVNSNSTNQEVIISFDLEKETYGEVLLPQYDGINVYNPVLYVSSDCICVCFNNYESWDVWMMKEYGVVESWTKLMIIPEKKLISDNIPRFHLFKALLISENGVHLLITKDSELFVYNFNNGCLDYHRNFVKFVCGLHIYQESLISPQWLKQSE